MKNIFFLMLGLVCSLSMLAMPACPDSIQVTQPDGTKLWSRVHGDEFYNWLSTTDGNVILYDEQNGYCYAMIKEDSLISSQIMVHNVGKRTNEEVSFIKERAIVVQKFIKTEQNKVLVQNRKELAMAEEQTPQIATQAEEKVSGEKKILTILVGFKDRPFTKTTADFDKLMNQKYGPIEGNHGSLWQYYNEDSYGELNVSATVVGPFEAKHESRYYKMGKDDGTSKVRELVREAIHWASDSGVDFSKLDGDNDGYVDCVHIVFAGHGMSSLAEDGLIWEHRSELALAIIKDGKKAKQYIITPELGTDNKIAPIGTICHEFGHILGAPDFYDRIDNAYCATGEYDVMCNGGWNNDGHRPAHHNAYTKCYLFGWGHSEIITDETKKHRIASSTLKPIFYRINTNNSTEYFLIENRIQVNFDKGIPNEGLLIYHIHKDLATSIDKWELINSQHPLQCYIVNASATQNPTSNPTSYGSYDAERAFGLGDRTYFGIRSTPSFTAWDGSGTGIDICFIMQNPDKSISFTVNPQIEGPDHLCGERTYSVTGTVPDKDTIVWSYASNIEFIRAFPVLKFPNGRQGASVSVVRGAQFVRLVDEPIGDRFPDSLIMKRSMADPQSSGQSVWAPYTGTVTLAATVHSGNGTYRIEKEIELPKNKAPELDIPFAQKMMWFANQTRTFTEKGNPNIEGAYIKWYVKYPKDIVFTEYTGRSVSLTPTKAGILTIRVVNDCGCPTRNETTYTFDILSTVRPPYINMSYPNPVTTSTLPVVVEQDHSNASDIAVQSIADDLPEYTIELWSDLLGRVRTITSNEPRVEIDIAGLPSGWYQLLLLQNGQLIDSGKVLIGQ